MRGREVLLEESLNLDDVDAQLPDVVRAGVSRPNVINQNVDPKAILIHDGRDSRVRLRQTEDFL